MGELIHEELSEIEETNEYPTANKECPTDDRELSIRGYSHPAMLPFAQAFSKGLILVEDFLSTVATSDARAKVDAAGATLGKPPEKILRGLDF